MPNKYATVNFSELDYFLKRSKFCDGWLLYWVRYALFAFFAAQRTFIHRSEIGPLSTLVDCVVRLAFHDESRGIYPFLLILGTSPGLDRLDHVCRGSVVDVIIHDRRVAGERPCGLIRSHARRVLVRPEAARAETLVCVRHAEVQDFLIRKKETYVFSNSSRHSSKCFSSFSFF